MIFINSFIYKFIVINIFLTVSIFASQIFWLNNYHMARFEAKKINKDILLFISSVDNPFCDYMEEDIFKNKEIVDHINKNYLAVKLIIETDNLPQGLLIFSAPTIYFLTNKGKQLHERITGEVTPKQILKFLKEIKKAK